MDILNHRFQVEKTLGKKAGRQTLLARDLHTQKRVVVKLLTFGNEFEWNQLKLFEREAGILKSLSHPAIPKYLDYFELDPSTGKGFALVQSYIEAISLEQHLKSGRSFTQTEVKQLAIALLEILDYLHRRQPAVIHRDIKPSNILLSDRTGNHVGRVHLVDFGSVQSLAPQDGNTMTVVGTYGYMPPEQFGGRTTPASDLYSLGATLIYLVTGRHPADLPQQNLRLQFRPFTTLSEPLLDWLEWLTEPSVDDRPKTAAAALNALTQEQLRSELQPFDPPESVVQTNTPQIFWNAVWRISSVSVPISTLIAFIIASSGGYGFVTLQGLLLICSVVTGVAAGLGFANGLLLAMLTRKYFSPIRNAGLYRLAMTGAATTFSAVLMAIALSPIVTGTDVLLVICVIAATMGVAGHWFADWYVRFSRNLLRRVERSRLPFQ